MTRVLHILTDSNIGGAGRYLINYLRSRNREQFDVSVVLPAGSRLLPEVRAMEVPVFEAEGIADRSLSLPAVAGLKKLLREQKPDLVHTHGSFSGRIAAKQCRIPVIYTRHSAFPVPSYLKKGPAHRLYSALDRRYADHVIAVSPAAADNLRELGVPEDRITVMMNGAPALEPLTPAQKAAVREALGIPEGLFTAGIFARLEPYKGHTLLLSAARALKDEGRDFRILIGGSGSRESALRELDDQLAGAARLPCGASLVARLMDGDANLIRDAASRLIRRPGVIALLGARTGEGRATFVFARSEDVDSHMGKLLSDIARPLGGKGGGRPDFAQGGGPVEILYDAERRIKDG